MPKKRNATVERDPKGMHFCVFLSADCNCDTLFLGTTVQLTHRFCACFLLTQFPYLGFDTTEINLVPQVKKGAGNKSKNLCDSFSVFLLLLHISKLVTAIIRPS